MTSGTPAKTPVKRPVSDDDELTTDRQANIFLAMTRQPTNPPPPPPLTERHREEVGEDGGEVLRLATGAAEVDVETEGARHLRGRPEVTDERRPGPGAPAHLKHVLHT